VTITDRDVEPIVKALKVEPNPHRLCLFPQVLNEWARTELVEYASLKALRASSLKEVARYARVSRSAKDLVDAIDALIEGNDLVVIEHEMARAAGSIVTRERRGHLSRKVIEHRDFLNHLRTAVDSLQHRLKKGPGQPRNTVAYLVLLDLAAIFSWLTGTEAKREVDRMRGCETGAFYHFCAAVWPLVFHSETHGLPAAMKNWAFAHQEYEESSALLANIDLRHSSWGVFSR
jgi:hypothetical protein